jgi:hypothetical protein
MSETFWENNKTTSSFYCNFHFCNPNLKHTAITGQMISKTLQ